MRLIKIIFNADGSEIKVTNPTGFYITFYKFKVMIGI